LNHRRAESPSISSLTLGTAQLGLEYGIANKTGKPRLESACEILQVAVESGINTFDTAPGYGSSEEIIGAFVSTHSHSLVQQRPVIVTKIPMVQCQADTSFKDIYAHIRTSLLQSGSRLRLRRIPICLLHNAPDMLRYGGLVARSLLELKREGLVSLVGISAYHPEDVEQFLEFEKFDAIQIPINILDTRLIKQGLLNELAQREVLVFARSVFLQGLFFLGPNHLPLHLISAQEPLMQLERTAHSLGRSVAEIAITFVRDLPGITSVVLGVETVGQLRENIKHMGAAPLPKEVAEAIPDMFRNVSEHIIDPSKWNKGG